MVVVTYGRIETQRWIHWLKTEMVAVTSGLLSSLSSPRAGGLGEGVDDGGDSEWGW
ncbi:hypothetical protein HanHA89_Chr03g0109951 [Helianthus annuus]|nr:hypothetical protein HanHA89_Chr03g0109951 [Helianthus annuus]